MSVARGEYVPAPCTHRPSKHPSEVRMRPQQCGRIWASQGGLSRNKVAVGESAAGSPPTVRDLPRWGRLTTHTQSVSAVFVTDSTRLARRFGHLRTTKANIVLGWETNRGGLIAQRQSASFARRMPWVRIPLSPSAVRSNHAPYMGDSVRVYYDETDAPSRVSGVGRVEPFSATTLEGHEIVCTCNPGVHWTQYNRLSSLRRLITT